MEHNRNSESRDESDERFFDNEGEGGHDPWAGRPGEPSPHVQPGEKTWVEAEMERRAAGHPPRFSLPGEDRLPHEVPPPPRRTGTGFFYKSGDEVPPTHPDHGPMEELPRREDGGFAAYYYCSKAELYDAEIPGPPPRRHRHDGWAPDIQENFLEALAACASWTEACRAVDRSRNSAYRLYNRSPAFRAACDAALKPVAFILSTTAFDRAVNGVEEIVYHERRRVGVKYKYDNKLLMQLLRSLDPLRSAPLSEIEGWLKRRGIERDPELDSALDRLAAAEHRWGQAAEDPDAGSRPALDRQACPEPVAETCLAAPGEPAEASSSSSSPADGAADASSSSTSPPAEPPPEPLPEGMAIYRPPPVGRVYLA
jgi:hypothetical protein